MSVVERDREPLAPRVGEALARMETRQGELKEEIASTALDEWLDDPKARDRRIKAERELASVEAEVRRLRLAREQAEQRDEQAAAAVEIAELEAGLVEFEAAAGARLAAAVALDKAAVDLAEAWSRLRAASDLIVAIVPAGTHLPRGYQATNLRQLAKATIYRHSGIANPGDEAMALPGGEPPSLMTRFNPEAIPAAAEVIGAECAWLVRSIKNQIELTAKFRRGEIKEAS